MLGRFLKHADKVFDLSRSLSAIEDTRPRPRIPTAAVLMSSFIMHLTRRDSLNALDAERRMPKKLDSFIGPHNPSADTIGRVYTQIDPDQLRRLHRGHCARLKRNKVLETVLPPNAWWDGCVSSIGVFLMWWLPMRCIWKGRLSIFASTGASP